MASLFAEASVFSQAMDTVGHTTVTTDVNRMKMTEALVHTLQQQVSKFVVCFTPEVPQILAAEAEFMQGHQSQSPHAKARRSKSMHLIFTLDFTRHGYAAAHSPYLRYILYLGYISWALPEVFILIDFFPAVHQCTETGK